MEILKIRNEDGTWTTIPAIKGDTPVKGTDYFTDADKQEMVQLVLAAMPSTEEVNY